MTTAITTLDPIGYAIIGISLALIFLIGFWAKDKIKTPDDFYVAGRNLNPWLLAATLTATNVNLYSFIGQSGTAYGNGPSIIWQTWTGNMAMVLAAFLVLPIMRRLLIKTIPEMLEIRYGYSVRAMVAILWIFRLLMWTAFALWAAVLPLKTATGLDSAMTWILVLGLVTMIYTSFGGMWSVAITDAVQLVLMWVGLIVLFVVSMVHVGWFNGLLAKLPAGHLDLIPSAGNFNWIFLLSIFFLGLQWASTDQGLLQRNFGARSNKALAKGMVYAGIITTVMAVLWVGTGLAAQALHPGITNTDLAIPTLLINSGLPQIVFAFIIVGFLAASMSTTSSNLNATVTLFCSDLYQALINKKASGPAVVKMARVITLLFGAVMVLFALFVASRAKSLVDGYLTLIGIMDMPLFIVAVIYAFLWKRANTAGAIGGYLTGATAGAVAYFAYDIGFNYTAFISGGVALIACPIISLLTPPPDPAKVQNVFAAKHPSKEEIDAGNSFHIWPISFGGRLSMLILFLGVAGFLAGTILGSIDYKYDSLIAIAGMIVFFIGGLLRLKFD
jgi:SSS family solute:Na+ symporter